MSNEEPSWTIAEQNAIFEKEIKLVYAEIDKNSELLWIARNDSEFIRYGSSIGERTRTRQNDKTDDEPGWEQDSNASLGYGEITRGAFTTFLSYLQGFEAKMK